MAPPDSPSPAGSDGVTFRRLESAADYDACVELQRATWGRDFGEVVPASILKINQKVGGVSAGAFGAGGRMLGFVYGQTGLQGDPPRRVHWSHMLAVDPEARDLGLGTRLKLYQRELLLPLEVEEIQWTYDPLEARNAHLNLNRLGAEVAEYVEDMYANEMGSELARGIGTDRFIVAWRIQSARVEERVAGRLPDLAACVARYADAPVANTDATGAAEGVLLGLPEAPRVLVEIPASIQTVKADDPEGALAWRLSTRRAFEEYLARGYRVETFWRDPERARGVYGLTASDSRP
jgi:predicted GNAT superfamily acetyltransferase